MSKVTVNTVDFLLFGEGFNHLHNITINITNHYNPSAKT